MEPAAAASLSGALPLPSVQGAAAPYCLQPSVCASGLPAVPPSVGEDEAARRRQEEDEYAAIRLVHLLVTCANLIEKGDYLAALRNLAEARTALATTVSTAAGIGRVASHFVDALDQRLCTASADRFVAAPDVGEYRQYYEAGPYLKFAHFTANQAILEAFEGCDRVHVLDLAIMRGVQWPALIKTLSLRPGGPPALRITGVGPPRSHDVLNKVGNQLTDFARSVNVPFSFCGVTANSLDDALQPWMLQLFPGETLAVNSICQLHRLLVDLDAASTSLPSPINTILRRIAAMQPKVFTVVEQEANHNQPSLMERFTNALFYYSAVFDSMEAISAHRRTNTSGGIGADAYLKREIFDIVCGEGSARVERHEPFNFWHARLGRAGFAQAPLGPSAIVQAEALLRGFSGAGYRVQEQGGCLKLAWNGHPLFTTSVWHAARTNAAHTGIVEELVGSNESSGHQQAVLPGWGQSVVMQ
jgi:DELLA protein